MVECNSPLSCLLVLHALQVMVMVMEASWDFDDLATNSFGGLAYQVWHLENMSPYNMHFVSE